MRLFVAIELGATIVAEAATLVDALKRRVGSVSHAKLTWVDPARMHLTVRFIGEVDDAGSARVEQALTPPIPVAPFTLTPEGLRAFPGQGRPRVIACDISTGREQLLQVEVAVSARLESIDIPREARPYSPHITLARVRDAGRLRARDFLDGLEDVSLGTTRVEAITLFQSRLSPKGPTYTALTRTPLAV